MHCSQSTKFQLNEMKTVISGNEKVYFNAVQNANTMSPSFPSKRQGAST